MPSIKQRVFAERRALTATFAERPNEEYIQADLPYLSNFPKPATDNKYSFSGNVLLPSVDERVNSLEIKFRLDDDETLALDSQLGFISVQDINVTDPDLPFIQLGFKIKREVDSSVLPAIAKYRIHIFTDNPDLPSTESKEAPIAFIESRRIGAKVCNQFHVLKYNFIEKSATKKFSIVTLDGREVWRSTESKWTSITSGSYAIICNIAGAAAKISTNKLSIEYISFGVRNGNVLKYKPSAKIVGKITRDGFVENTLNSVEYKLYSGTPIGAGINALVAVNKEEVNKIITIENIDMKTRMIGKKTNTDTDKVVYSTVNTYN